MSFDTALPDGWYWSTLDEVRAQGKSVVSGPFGSNIGSRFFVASGVPVIRGSNLTTGMDRFREDEFVFLTPEKAAEFTSCEAISDDLIFTAAGTIGQVGLIPKTCKYPKYIISNKQLRARLDVAKIDPEFAYYWFASPTMVQTIQSRNTGSTIPLINLTVLKSLPIPVPPLNEQREIAGHLAILDDRITLLRETNATLEAIAQALFKSWFVDFDPVRAKMAGRAPEGMDEATAALFPDVLEETELGSVPKGWQVCAVEDFAEKVGMGPFGSNIKVETFVESGVPVISGQHLKQMMVEDNTFNFITPEHAEKLAKSCVQHGDVIFTHAGSIGQVSYLHKDSEYQSYVLSQRQFFLRCDPGLMSSQWITRFFKSPSGQHLLLANTSQVGVPSIARPVTYLRSIRLVIPPPPVMQQFSSVCAALDDRVICNRKHIAALTQVRDTLLPRLISGQLRLPEAHAQLEDALA